MKLDQVIKLMEIYGECEKNEKIKLFLKISAEKFVQFK